MKKSAFTLIELLVVISIIAILAGIALPVYNKVMEKSRATSCASNLKQLGLGVAAYLNDSDETIFDKDAAGDPWPKVLQEKYVTNWKVFKCPFDKRSDAVTDATSYPISYGINEKVLTRVKDKWDGNFSKLVAPSQLILMAPDVETNEKALVFNKDNIAKNPVSLKSRSGETKKLGTHVGRAQINALFADSHVSSLKYLPATDADSFTSSTKEPGTSPLSGIILKWEPVKP